MTAKHAPATPLPWGQCGKDSPAVTASHEFVAYVHGHCHGQAGQNCAYIAHAANAYPGLIEALRSLGKLAETTTRPSGAPEVCRTLLDIAGISAALLRSLGED